MKSLCCSILGQPKEKVICNGIDLQTNEIVQFHLSKSIIVKIQQAMKQKPTKFQRLLMWIEKLFKQPPRHKVITIAFNGKTYEVKSLETCI